MLALELLASLRREIHPHVRLGHETAIFVESFRSSSEPVPVTAAMAAAAAEEASSAAWRANSAASSGASTASEASSAARCAFCAAANARSAVIAADCASEVAAAGFDNCSMATRAGSVLELRLSLLIVLLCIFSSLFSRPLSSFIPLFLSVVVTNMKSRAALTTSSPRSMAALPPSITFSFMTSAANLVMLTFSLPSMLLCSFASTSLCCCCRSFSLSCSSHFSMSLSSARF
mmetsp:Transcript_22825/g.67374  ORF Transcript_22825/g.67374 Transcript_22825/m.67374 type:complete len:232 (-) Transcript_22825:2140-2835(-)